jgi:hypothetical protein
MIARAVGRQKKPDMDKASRYVIAREDNVVHDDFDRDSRPPRPPFPGAAALRAGSSSSAHERFDYLPVVGQAARRKAAQD